MRRLGPQLVERGEQLVDAPVDDATQLGASRLTTAPHHLYREWHDKAVAFVGFGVEGGIRAVEHLRQITAELGMAGVGRWVALSIFYDFDADGRCEPLDQVAAARERTWTSLLRWAAPLRELRRSDAESPASAGATTAAVEPSSRPVLHRDDPAASAASAAVERFVLEL